MGQPQLPGEICPADGLRVAQNRDDLRGPLAWGDLEEGVFLRRESDVVAGGERRLPQGLEHQAARLGAVGHQLVAKLVGRRSG